MVDISQISKFIVSNGNEPQSGIVFSFSQLCIAGQPVSVDLRPLIDIHRIKGIQSVFIDNSAGTATFYFGASAGQSIAVPAGSQAIMPVFLSATMVVNLAGTGLVNIVLLNFSVPAAVWPSANISPVPVVNGFVQSQNYVLSGDNIVLPQYAGGIIKSFVINTIAPNTVITGAPHFFIQSIDIGIKNNSTNTVGGVDIIVNDGNHQLFYISTGVPTTGSNAIGISQLIHFEQLNYRSIDSNSNLTINIDVAIPGGGAVATFVCGVCN